MLPRPQELNERHGSPVEGTREGDGEHGLDAHMAALADGERDAFDPLFRALHPRALRVARARLHDDARAADAAQNALVRLFARASEFEPGRPVLPWFYAILANEIRAALRDAARGRDGARTDAAAAPLRPLETFASDDDPERDLSERELHAAFEAAIASLDAVSAEAIGALLGRRPAPSIAPAALRKRVSRAYARLRLLLGGSR